MNTNPGFIRENLKKSDGSSYGLRDLLNINRREKARSTKYLQSKLFQNITKSIMQLQKLFLKEISENLGKNANQPATLSMQLKSWVETHFHIASGFGIPTTPPQPVAQSYLSKLVKIQ